MQMRGLKICLWIAGVLCLLSIIGMFLPMSTLHSVAKAFGVESIPDSHICEYVVRLMSATYAGVGVYFIILALNPIKYGVLIPFTGWAAIVLGLICAIVGSIVKMPPQWFLGDFVSCTVLGVLILVFWRKARS